MTAAFLYCSGYLAMMDWTEVWEEKVKGIWALFVGVFLCWEG